VRRAESQEPRRRGIVIASPDLGQQRDRNSANLPDRYPPGDYVAPGFRLLPIERPTAGPSR